MCDQAPTPLHERSFAERNAIVEASCIKCTCARGSITVLIASTAWWKIAIAAPRDKTMMTDAPAKGNAACNPIGTNNILLNVYKKQNKGCRGWICCFRQQSCVGCTVGSTATHCY